MTRLLPCILAFLCPFPAAAAEFHSAWPENVERVWIGPEYWANPLQDWRLHRGRLECAVSGGNRNIYLLTHDLGQRGGGFEMRVHLGLIGPEQTLGPGWGGFRLGIRGEVDEYRYAALRGVGLNAGVTTAGQPFIGDEQAREALRASQQGSPVTGVELRLKAEPVGGAYRVTLAVHDPASGENLRQAVRENVPADELTGALALVSEHAPDLRPANQNSYGPGGRRGGNVRFWFEDWSASGPKVEAHAGRAWGPILWAQHTLSRGVMKMTAQMPPIGPGESDVVKLQIRKPGSREWSTIDEEHIHTLARTATFRIPEWDASRDVPYRLVYELTVAGGKTEPHVWAGTVRRDPVDKSDIVVAAFTGNQDTGFPNTHTVRNVEHHNPDVLFFSGDQLYENVAGFGIQREPVETSALDYLRKWWLLGWSFGDLMRDRVTVHMPDDHDVYQGNIWGGGGRKIPLEEHDRGGYAMPWEWVNMVQRTQTSHLPDPYDPRPVEQGITVYFTDLNYGRVSFAILEDRKFKSGPKGLVPPTGGRADHITGPSFDPRDYDVPGARLLGERQLAFLRDWAANWSFADFKVALSQTIFANAATTHGANMMRLAADLDSNGWPQSGRNRALRELRRGFAFMIGGDQHLPSIIHHGVDEFRDAGFSFCVPSISAGYPRAYEPVDPPANPLPGRPAYSGDRLDGLGNHMTVYAVANPTENQRESPLEKLHDKSSGYGIVRFHKPSRRITMECWKLLQDASRPTPDSQFEGWPLTIDQTGNYGRNAVAYLPEIRVSGMQDPVVQVIDERGNEIVYTLRMNGTRFRPKVFRQGSYRVHVGEPETDQFQVFPNIASGPADDGRTIEIRF